jgi:hypothetical protein
MAEKHEFSPQYLQQLMPSSRKKKKVQLLKRFKNHAMQMCEEVAKQDRDHCEFRLQRLEMGATLIHNIEEMAEDLASWLVRRGFRADIDADDPLLVHIEWGPEREEPEAPPPLPVPRGPALQAQGAGSQWFGWMESAQGKTPAVKRKG